MGKAKAGASAKVCWYCEKVGHMAADCRNNATYAEKKLAAALERPVGNDSAAPRAALLQGSDEASRGFLLPMLPAGPKRVMVDAGTGASVCPASFDAAASADTSVKPVALATAAGEEARLRDGKRSRLQAAEGTGVTLRYSSSEQVAVPVVSASDACGAGNWLVFGPRVQKVISARDARGLRQVAQATPGLEMVGDRGVYWLELWDEQPAGDARPLCPAKPAKKVFTPPVGIPPACGSGAAGIRRMPHSAGRGLEPERESESAPASAPRASGPAPAPGRPDSRPPTLLAYSEEARGLRAKKIPPTVTQAEWDSHQLTHLPFRSWCDHCASGKATEGLRAQRGPEAEGAVPKICVDYLFLTSKRDEQEMHAVLNVLDAKSGGPFPGMVNRKGEGDYALALMSEAVRFCGRANVLLLPDGEKPINRLVDVFTETRSSKHSASKRVEKEYRALKHRLESVCRQQFPLKYKIQPWLVRRAGWLLVRFLVKADGNNPCSRLFGKDYNGEIVEFGECVRRNSPLSTVGKADDRWHLGVWLGKSMGVDERLVGASNGVLTCRSIWRRPLQRRWKKQLLDAFVGSPWEPQRPLHQHRPHRCQRHRSPEGPEAQGKWFRSHAQQELPRPPVEASKQATAPRTSGQERSLDCQRCASPAWRRQLWEEQLATSVQPWMGEGPEVVPINMDWSKEYFSTKAGVKLDPQKVCEEKIMERRHIDACEVQHDISWSDARQIRLKLVNGKWVLEPKPSEADPGAVRARLVATKLNAYASEDATQSTPPVKIYRIIVSLAAFKQRPDLTWARLVAGCDVSVAFFRAVSTGKTAVIPPADVRKEGFAWLLRKAMHGAREASMQFGSYVIKALIGEGFVMIMVVPMVFVHHALDISLGCHGDELDNIMQRHFDVNMSPRIGPPEHGGQAAELKHFKRTIRLMELQGLKLGSPRGMTAPSSKYAGKGCPDCQVHREHGDGGMATSTKMHALRLNRCARYPPDHPGEIWIFVCQEMPTHLSEYCDSDWAADRETRTSVSCVVERFGEHMIDMIVSKQSLLALSSGEAESYAVVKGAAMGVQTTQIIEAMTRLPCKLVVLSDSSTARGICDRQGSGKVRYLSVKDLWVQEFLREKRGELLEVDGSVNWADLGAK
ncbi:unnamed protein product, partial [Prorocentrum cordatum]